jgi:hypothetical protein
MTIYLEIIVLSVPQFLDLGACPTNSSAVPPIGIDYMKTRIVQPWEMFTHIALPAYTKGQQVRMIGFVYAIAYCCRKFRISIRSY